MIVDLCVFKGEDFAFVFPAIDADDSYSVSIQIKVLWDKIASIDNAISISSDGVITLIIDRDTTEEVQSFYNYRYAIAIESVGNVVSYPFEGIVTFIPTATAV